MKIYQLLIITALLLFNQSFAEEITIDFDGTEGAYLTKVLEGNDTTEQYLQDYTDKNGVIKNTVYHGGDSNPSAVYFFHKTAKVNLYEGDLTFEGIFYNRSSTNINYNESTFIIGPFGSLDVGDNIIIGHNSKGFFANIEGAITSAVTRAFDSGLIETWHTMSVTFGIVSGKLVLKDLSVNNGNVLSNIEIADASNHPWLRNAHFGWGVDDMIDQIKITGPAVKASPSGLSSIPSTSLLTLILLMTGALSVSYYRFKSK